MSLKTFGLFGVGLLMTVGCAQRSYRPDDAPRLPSTGSSALVEAQLDGHLGRVRSCLGAEGSGLLDVRFAIGTDGRVHGTEVHRNTSGSSEVEACVHRRIASLYFDPAPARTIERDHRFAFCADDSTDTCRLGPVVGGLFITSDPAGELPR